MIDIEARENKEWLRKYMFSVPVVHFNEKVWSYPDMPYKELKEALVDVGNKNPKN